MGDFDTYTSLLNDNRIYFPRGGDGMPRKKYFKTERPTIKSQIKYVKKL
jgi:hypothetical protein